MPHRVLFIDINNNSCIVKLPSLFHQSGMQCFGLSREKDLLFKSSYLSQKYGLVEREGNVHFSDLLKSTFFAMKHGKPDFLITNEEQVLHRFIEAVEIIKERDPNNEDEARFVELISASMVQDKNLLLRPYSQQVAQNAGFLIPDHKTITDSDTLNEVLETHPRPFYLKVSITVGGQGVFKIEEHHKTEWIEHALTAFTPPSEARPYLIQNPVEGKEMTISFAAFKGKLLGYTVAEPLKKLVDGGPSSYLQTHYRPDLESNISNFVKLTGYSGFGGFDIIEEPSSKASYVIEANMRLTHSVPASRQQGTNLVQLLSAAIKGEEPAYQLPIHGKSKVKIALYPEEAMRYPESPHLEDGLVAAPWADPGAMIGLAPFIKRDLKYPTRDIEAQYKKHIEGTNAV
ncbi:MAG: ATP-grasp domain-containing protein [Sneathiella sp.]|nr:ATP-grasp domain-containing protein [Sneathiella sp.]